MRTRLKAGTVTIYVAARLLDELAVAALRCGENRTEVLDQLLRQARGAAIDEAESFILSYCARACPGKDAA